MNVTELNVTKHLVAASFVLALTETTGALAAPPLPPVGTLTIPAPFGSSPVLAWSWQATTTLGGGSGAGKASIEDLSITRNADGQSPLLFSYLARGLNLPTVVLVDGSTTITLSEVVVVGYTTADGPDAKTTTRTENVKFSFARIAYTVNGVTTCFDIATNTSC